MLLEYWGQVLETIPVILPLANKSFSVMGGYLADPVISFPGIFGPEGCFEFPWLRNYPYALPSLLNALFLSITACIVFFGLEEVLLPHPFKEHLANDGKTLKGRKGKFDFGLYLKARVTKIFWKRSNRHGCLKANSWDTSDASLNNMEDDNFEMKAVPRAFPAQKLPFNRIWTRNVVLTLITIAFFDFQLGSVNHFLCKQKSNANIFQLVHEPMDHLLVDPPL
jgi:hypothetical protein